tara:strand:- start:81 stop:401 length:321 start_codon:yes stop_codon:yes gene_type:complete
MTIRELFYWIIDLEISNILIFLFWLSVAIYIIYRVAIYFLTREEKQRLHLKMMENEQYKNVYLKKRRSSRIFWGVSVLLIALYLSFFFFTDTYYNLPNSFFNFRNW